MPNSKKIYTDDPLIKYTSTEKTEQYTKMEIDSVLGQYQVKQVFWNTDFEGNDVWVAFKIEELIDDIPVLVSVKIRCPIIWDRAKNKRRPYTVEKINWKVSMRAMYHYIYNALNNSYAMQSAKTVAFLGFVQTNKDGQVLKDVLIPKLNQYALPEPPKDEPPSEIYSGSLNDKDKPKIIDITPSKSSKCELCGEEFTPEYDGAIWCEACSNKMAV